MNRCGESQVKWGRGFTSLTVLLYFCHVVSFVLLVITILLIALSLSLCGAESIEQRTPIQIHLGRLLQNRIWVPVAVGLAIPSLLAARFIFQQGSPPVWPHYSWQFFAWPLYGLTATVNRPANLVISSRVSVLFASLVLYSMCRADNGNTSLRNGLFYAIAATFLL